MADDTHSTHGGRRKLRGPFVVTNPNNDSDDENNDRSHYITPFVPPPLPTNAPSPPATHLPYSQYPQLQNTGGGSASNKLPYERCQLPANQNSSNPSLSSPSGSSSPAVDLESTPPPSTPGISTQQSAVVADDPMYTFDRSGGPILDGRNDVRQYVVGARNNMMDKVKQHLSHRRNLPSTRIMPVRFILFYLLNHEFTLFQTPIVTNTNNVTITPQTALKSKLLLVTADCDNFTPLDISGCRNAPMIREKIYSKVSYPQPLKLFYTEHLCYFQLQISDDQQAFFSIFRTQIGSFATSEALSDEALMKIYLEEVDHVGTVKLLAQHSSAPLHLNLPPPRNLTPNHVPPVLPYQESFRSPSRKARSTKSNHETMSSTSESFPMDPVSAGYEASSSADDVDTYEREKNRQTIRPSVQNRYISANPPSPHDQRRGPIGARDQSPAHSRRGMSPTRLQLFLDTQTTSSNQNSSLLTADRLRAFNITKISPDGTYLDDNAATPPPRHKHVHSNSDAAAERERVLEYSERFRQDQAERQLQERESFVNRDVRGGQDPNKRRAKITDPSDSSSSRVQEPWVIVPSPQKNDRPSTADAGRSPSSSRPTQHTPSASHSGPYPSSAQARFPYSLNVNAQSRPNISQIPAAPRNPPPQVPVSTPTSARRGQPVPQNWLQRTKFFGDERPKYLGDEQQKSRNVLSAAKSMDNLRGFFHGTSSSSQRKASQNSMSRPSIVGLKEAANSTGSFMNLDPSPSRRDPSTAGLPRSFESRSNFSPTTYTPSRSSPMAASQSQGEPTQTQFRPLPPTANQSSLGSSGLLNAPLSQNTYRQSPEDPYPRPHSAFGNAPDSDIGASPAPPRSFRPLPTTSASWVDVEAALSADDSRSPRVASPHHPYAAAQATNMRSLPSSKSLASSNLTLADTMAPDGTNTRSPRALPSPESPRHVPVDKRDAVLSAPAMSADKSFGPMTDDSPVAYEGDNEGGAPTLRGEDHAWVSSLLSHNTSSSEGTLKAGVSGQRPQVDKPLPNPHAGDSSPYTQRDFSSSYDTSRNLSTTDVDEYGTDEDEDSDDDGGGTGLWKQPPKKELDSFSDSKRPALSVHTDSSKDSATIGPSRGNYSASHPPPNFPPPPSYPPPGPRRSRKGSKGDKGMKGDHRRSRFYKDNNVTWAFRPRAEEMYDKLEEYFPDHDLDKPLIESTSGGSSPTAAEPAIPAFQGSSADKDRKFRHKKSIRIVAAEHKKKIDHTDSSPANSMLRKRSTKLWGSKVEEVTTSQLPNIPSLPESPTAANPKRT